MEYFVTCNGIPVHVSDNGEGDKVFMLLHGYLETLYIWEEFKAYLPDSSRIICIDLPGAGLSGSDPFINTMDFGAKVLLDLLDRLNVCRPCILGHSLGGYLGQRFLADYPDRLSALVNLNSTPYPDAPEVARDRAKEIDFITNGKLMALAQLVIPNMYSRESLRRCDEKIAETIEICETHDPLGIAALVRGMAARESSVGVLSATKVPVMFIHGGSDHYIPMATVEKIVADLPSCRHSVLPSSGHNSFIEEPGDVASRILDFLSTAGC